MNTFTITARRTIEVAYTCTLSARTADQAEARVRHALAGTNPPLQPLIGEASFLLPDATTVNVAWARQPRLDILDCHEEGA